MLNRKSKLEKALEKFMTPKCPSEYAEQVAVIDWARANTKTCHALEYLFHIPNGGHRSKVSAARLKRAGVKKGIPDLMLPFPAKGYHGLFIEMKKMSGGKISDDQRSCHSFLGDSGYVVYICFNAKQAIKTICDYLCII